MALTSLAALLGATATGTVVTAAWPTGWLAPTGGRRRRRWAIALTVTLLLVAAVGLALRPAATVLMRTALPCDVGALHLTAYRRSAPAPADDAGERLRIDLPPAEALRWFMAASGRMLPRQAANAGANLSGELRLPGQPALRVVAVSVAELPAPHWDLRLSADRVNGWLADGAWQQASPWLLRLDPGTAVATAELPPPTGWQSSLELRASGLLVRRDGKPGLLRVARLHAFIDLAWSAGAGAGARMTPQLRVADLVLEDLAADAPLALPRLVWQFAVAAINEHLRRQPISVPLVPPAGTTIAIRLDGEDGNPIRSACRR